MVEKTLLPSGMVKLMICIEGRFVWVMAVVSKINGFDLLLGNDVLSQLRCFSVHYNEVGVGSFSTTTSTDEEIKRGQAGCIVNYETLSILAFSMTHVDVVVPRLDRRTPGHMVEPSLKVMADKGVSMGRLLLPTRVTGGTHRLPLTNFSSSIQFIPAGMVVGKIFPIDQALDDISDREPISSSTETLSIASRINQDLTDGGKNRLVA